MRSMRRLLRGKAYGALVALSVLCPSTLCYAQITFCYATGITESFSNMYYTSMMGMPPYTLHYDVTVKWNCSGGTTSKCMVCELDTLYKLNPATNMYEFFDSYQTTDMQPACASPNTSVWTGTVSGLPAGGNLKLVAAYKNINGTGCDDPTGFSIGATKFFPGPP